MGEIMTKPFFYEKHCLFCETRIGKYFLSIFQGEKQLSNVFMSSAFYGPAINFMPVAMVTLAPPLGDEESEGKQLRRGSRGMSQTHGGTLRS